MLFELPATRYSLGLYVGEFLLQPPSFSIKRLVLWYMQNRSVFGKVSIFGGVEECQGFVILRVADRIIRMRMTLHAIHSQTVEHRPGRRRPIHHCDCAEFLVIRSAFIIDWCLAMEGRCDLSLKRS